MTQFSPQIIAISDDALLVMYANGDPSAATQLTSRHASRLVGFAYRMLQDFTEAEDVAQDTMLRLWKMAPDWEPGRAQLSTWLFQVANNLCIDRLRKRRTVPLDGLPEPKDDTPDVEQAMISSERQNALNAALATLPDRQRQAVVLRHIEGLSNPEIADILEISVEATESLTARGKRNLTAALAPKKEELGL